jgi:hypothetical protein
VDNSVGDLGAPLKKALEIVPELDCRNITQKLKSIKSMICYDSATIRGSMSYKTSISGGLWIVSAGKPA